MDSGKKKIKKEALKRAKELEKKQDILDNAALRKEDKEFITLAEGLKRLFTRNPWFLKRRKKKK